jgi:hypothetical protein
VALPDVEQHDLTVGGLRNNKVLKAKIAAGTSVNMMKVSSSDELFFYMPTDAKAVYFVNQSGTYKGGVYSTGRIDADQYYTAGGQITTTSLRLPRVPYRTTAQIEDKANDVNTTQKDYGNLLLNITTNKMMFARGSADTALWTYVDGSASLTPV